MKRRKILLIVLDAVGAGNAPDAVQYGDEGANTLLHVFQSASPHLPNLTRMGLGNIPGIGFEASDAPSGAFGRMREQASGKDTTTGHWEIAGLTLDRPFPTYPNGFPKEVIDDFERVTGFGTLGNYPASGTQIIADLGEEHLKTGKLIVYTSADSVFQIAAHEDIVPHEQLWRICEQARQLLCGKHGVGRVIARPFTGTVGNFTRTGDRRDFSLVPPSDTLLDVLKAHGFDVWGVGKIEDIFAHRGMTHSIHSAGNPACIATMMEMLRADPNGLIFVNLVDTDSLYGHRNDPNGFARCLEAFDASLPEICSLLNNDDLLLITADHGCDPCFPGTDHSRELVPLLAWGKQTCSSDLGIRSTFADVAATVLDWFGIENTLNGISFASALLRKE